MDINTELMQAMLAQGYKIVISPERNNQVHLHIVGPGFASDKAVKDYSTAVGLAAYWLSESNGVLSDAKKAVDAILYAPVKAKSNLALDLLKEANVEFDRISTMFYCQVNDKIRTFLNSNP